MSNQFNEHTSRIMISEKNFEMNTVPLWTFNYIWIYNETIKNLIFILIRDNYNKKKGIVEKYKEETTRNVVRILISKWSLQLPEFHRYPKYLKYPFHMNHLQRTTQPGFLAPLQKIFLIDVGTQEKVFTRNIYDRRDTFTLHGYA